MPPGEFSAKDAAESSSAAAANTEALANEIRLLLTPLDELERELGRVEDQNRELLRRAEDAEALVNERDATIQELRAALAASHSDRRESEEEPPEITAQSPTSDVPQKSQQSGREQRLEAARRTLREIPNHDSGS